MKRRLVHGFAAVAAACCLFVSQAQATPIVHAFFDGPDSNFDINLHMQNDAASTSDIISFILDGSTGSTSQILWDGEGTPSGPPGSGVSFSGEGTQLLTVMFTDNPDGFNPGETMSLSGMDPDGVINPGLTVGELIGVGATFNFRDGSFLSGFFVDDSAAGAGVVFQKAGVAVPEPSILALFGIGAVAILAGTAIRRRCNPV